jgi:hypothetical protein
MFKCWWPGSQDTFHLFTRRITYSDHHVPSFTGSLRRWTTPTGKFHSEESCLRCNHSWKLIMEQNLRFVRPGTFHSFILIMCVDYVPDKNCNSAVINVADYCLTAETGSIESIEVFIVPYWIFIYHPLYLLLWCLQDFENCDNFFFPRINSKNMSMLLQKLFSNPTMGRVQSLGMRQYKLRSCVAAGVTHKRTVTAKSHRC